MPEAAVSRAQKSQPAQSVAIFAHIFTLSVAAPEAAGPQPRRGAMFIARGAPKVFFLFFGGAALANRR